jgi:ADP-glucose pyrophosphorylase
VVVEAGAVVEDSVVMHDTVVRAGARVERAIVDSRMEVPAGAHVHSTEQTTPVAIYGRTEA